MMLPLMRNPNTGCMLMILLLLKTTLVLCSGIYRMTYMSFLNGHQLMVLISMPKIVKPWRLFSVEPYHIMLTVLQIGSDKLEYVDTTKIMGLWLQNDLKWQTQVDVMCTTAVSFPKEWWTIQEPVICYHPPEFPSMAEN